MSEQSISNELKSMNLRFATLGKALPQVMGAFRNLMSEASKSGNLSPKVKELMALAIAVHKGCGDCILFHVSNAKSHGASREELAETLAVAIEMGGGPAAVYAGKALAAYDALTNDK
ncbi:carboxymuconolactone decarboxylase family protein [Xanthobacter oligotrophicus]|uniref:carboxymuconolactone decarboxylase family protein n=1 Tax=Xanthobacter oligotrophicus TaxID=2607286 RepID=UPI0011F0B193|nr:carboxymuconolactone decarboxylase family protein [Xanthobacter oligotrophicus]MCG5234119.1 carboxymuconolactone decarboxylase family protein [Xanthobacter oligotrophicus]